MAKINYVKLNHGLNIYCKFFNFILFGIFSENVNFIKQEIFRID